MGLVRKHNTDPVYVKSSWGRARVELRIGSPEGRGKSRFVLLESSEARKIAYELLLYAEHADEKKRAVGLSKG